MKTSVLCSFFLIASLFSTPTARAQGMFETGSSYGGGFGFGMGLGSAVGRAAGEGTSYEAGNKQEHRLTAEQLSQAHQHCQRALAEAQRLENAGRPTEAARLYRDLAAYKEQVFGADQGVVDSFCKAGMLWRSRNSKEAEDCWKRALGAATRKFGPGSQETMPILQDLRALCDERQNFVDSANYQQLMLRMEERRIGAGSPELLDANLKLAGTLVKAKRPAQATPYLNKSLELAEQTTDREKLARILKTVDQLAAEIDAPDQPQLRDKAEQLRQILSRKKDTPDSSAGAAASPSSPPDVDR